MLNRLLDLFVTRIGVAVSVAILAGVSVSTVLFFRENIAQIEAQQAEFERLGMRNGIVAISDIQRVTLALQKAVVDGEVTYARRREIELALDMLYARADGLLRESSRADRRDARVLPVIDDLFVLVDLGEAGKAAQFADVEEFSRRFLEAAERARRTTVQFLDEVRRDEDALFQRKSAALRRQAIILTIVLSVLSIAGALMVGLLRREVVARRARDVAERRVQFLAFFDPLTELANRVQFQERAERALAGRHPSALVFVDLDDFKGINDTFGHGAGDAVLRHTGRVLGQISAEEGGFAARIAGDEFALFLPTDDLDRVALVCDRLLAGFRQPVPSEAERISASISIGAATTTQVSPAGPLSFDEMSRVTDFALYASKSAGRGRYTLYDSTLEAEFKKRRALLDELPAAIERRALDVFLQPKFDLGAGEIFGFEALVRWRRKGQLVAPGEFIKVAEESNLIGQIDRFVLNEAARTVAEWNRRCDTAYSVSVNLSALHFASDQIVGTVQEVLTETGLPPALLTLEVTESVEISDWANVQHCLKGLRALGCRISIDDFGTGYSSFAYIREISADELKIDRSLLRQIEFSEEARFVLDAVLDLAQSLRLDVVVEGVETAEQVRILADLGASKLQGFLIGRPVPALEALSRAAAGAPQMRELAAHLRLSPGPRRPVGATDAPDPVRSGPKSDDGAALPGRKGRQAASGA